MVPAIQRSEAYLDGGAIFILWAEGAGSDGPIGMMVLSPLAKGHGYANDLWTLGRVAKLIWMDLGVSYDPSGVWHLLRRNGWSAQKPQRRAREQDEAAVESFRRRTWPALKKSRPRPASRSS